MADNDKAGDDGALKLATLLLQSRWKSETEFRKVTGSSILEKGDANDLLCHHYSDLAAARAALDALPAFLPQIEREPAPNTSLPDGRNDPRWDAIKEAVRIVLGVTNYGHKGFSKKHFASADNIDLNAAPRQPETASEPPVFHEPPDSLIRLSNKYYSTMHSALYYIAARLRSASLLPEAFSVQEFIAAAPILGCELKDRAIYDNSDEAPSEDPADIVEVELELETDEGTVEEEAAIPEFEPELESDEALIDEDSTAPDPPPPEEIPHDILETARAVIDDFTETRPDEYIARLEASTTEWMIWYQGERTNAFTDAFGKIGPVFVRGQAGQ